MVSTSTLHQPTETELKQALRLRNSVEALSAFFHRLLEDPTHRGCYMSVLNPEGQLVLSARIGYVSPEKEWKYSYFSLEKPRRILEHDGHCSSWQSRVVQEPRGILHYGGGLRFNGRDILPKWQGWAIGISGYPEAVDEAIALGAGYLEGAVNSEFAARVIMVSSHQYWRMAYQYVETHKTCQVQLS